MENKKKYLYYAIFALMVICSIATLPFSPIAWYDEVYFASATHSLISGNGLSVELDHFEPLRLYGPVYFLFTGLVAKICGFGIFSFRIVNCIFGLLSVFCFGMILKRYNIRKSVILIVELIFLTDIAFFQNSHSGRMEFVALFFVLLAYYLYLGNSNTRYKDCILISFFLTLSFLTTPRVIVIAAIPALMEFVTLVKERMWGKLMIYISIPLLLYSIWFFYAYGTIGTFVDYYTQGTQSNTINTHIGGNFHIGKYHYLMVIVAAIVTLYLLVKKKIKEFILFVIPILVFHSTVYEFGLYIAFVLPCYMFLLAFGLNESFTLHNKKKVFVMKLLVALCLLINITGSLFKITTILGTVEQRNPYTLSEWFKKQIPPGSKVAGNYAYYYAAIENNCSFKRITRDGMTEKEVFDDLINYDRPDYIILQEGDSLVHDPDFCSFYPIKRAKYEIKNNGETISDKLTKRLGMTLNYYEGTIYKAND